MKPFLDINSWIKYEGRFLFPYGFMLFLLVMNIISLPVPALFGVKVPFALMAIYYWSMYRPGMLPSWLLFVSGLVMDSISGVPFGLNAIIFVATGWLVARKRRFLLSQPFFVTWFFFALTSLLMQSVQWALFSLLSLSIVQPESMILSWGLGLFLFPSILLLLRLTHRMLPIKQTLGKV